MTFHRAHSWSRLFRPWLMIALALVWITSESLLAENKVQLQFKNGDFASGVLVDCPEANHIGLQCDAFEMPLMAHVDRIGALERKDDLPPAVPGEYSFLLSNHSTLVGKLIELSEENVTIRSRSLGDVTFPRKLLNEMVETDGVGKLLFVGPRAAQNWKSQPKEDAWVLEGGALTTSLAGHPIECDLQLPTLCEVRLKLSWTKFPGFMLAIGTPAEKQLNNVGPQPNNVLPQAINAAQAMNARQLANKQREPAAVRIESWGTTLTMVRSSSTETDFVALGELSQEGGRIDLVLYIDQKKGEVTACAPTGKVLGRVAVNDPNFMGSSNMMKLLNTSLGKDALRLERIQVRQWNERLPGQTNIQGGGVIDRQGNFIEGKIVQFDADKQTLSVRSGDKPTTAVQLASVGRVQFQMDSAAEDGASSPAQEAMEVQLADGSTCVAVWKSSTNGKAELAMEGFTAAVSSNLDQIIALSGNAASNKDVPFPARTGSLQNEQLKLTGYLSESSAPGALLWQSVCATAPAQLRSHFEGKIVYEAEVPKPVDTAKAKNRAAGGMGGMAMGAGGIQVFFANGMPNERNKPAEPTATTVSAGLTFRTGDVVAGKVEKIDEEGVTFQLGEKPVVAKHSNMDSVTLVERARIIELSPEKMKQLTTIPRAAKPDPPTHLFVSINGDYLRGRLLKYVDGRVTAEIRLESVEFPAGAIAQIYWLHSRDWVDKPKAKTGTGEEKSNENVKTDEDEKPKGDPTEIAATDSASGLLQVYAMLGNDKAVTFTPTNASLVEGTKDQLLKGRNELLGDCEVRISEVKSLLVGRDVGEIARKMQKDAWKLSVATLPKVYQEGDQPSEAGSSPLVGKPAPEFTLKTAGADNFTLSNLKGKVAVLDFWASWCGPCMQTMPEVDRIVEEVGGGQVELVAVNLQETKERALAAVKRLELTATVVLDADGEVAQKYEASAIPQTVIVDRAGNVTHVFVGGGSKFLKQFEEALSATLKQDESSKN